MNDDFDDLLRLANEEHEERERLIADIERMIDESVRANLHELFADLSDAQSLDLIELWLEKQEANPPSGMGN